MNRLLLSCFSILLLCSSVSYSQEDPQVVAEPLAFSQQELDQMLAPIALYPDAVLAHILISATYPLEVVQAARWTENNTDLSGESAMQAVDDKSWDPSVKALVAFPAIVQRMSNDLDWLQRLGDAYLESEEQLTTSIQNLRQRAYDEGNLESLEHLRVVREDNVIVIEPAVKEIVYVPYYDSRYIYGSWWWAGYPPVHWYHPSHHRDHQYYTSFYWGPSIRLNWSFFFGGFHWNNRHIRVIDRHLYKPYHYYSGRQVVHYKGAHQWRHNPRHRRGVVYHNRRTQERFHQRSRPAKIHAGSFRSKHAASAKHRDQRKARKQRVKGKHNTNTKHRARSFDDKHWNAGHQRKQRKATTAERKFHPNRNRNINKRKASKTERQRSQVKRREHNSNINKRRAANHEKSPPTKKGRRMAGIKTPVQAKQQRPRKNTSKKVPFKKKSAGGKGKHKDVSFNPPQKNRSQRPS